LKPRYVVKKDLRKCLITIELANNHLEEARNPQTGVTEFIMVIRKTQGFPEPSWDEKIDYKHSVPKEIENSYVREMAEDIVQNFNNTLRSGESPRELVAVLKRVTLTTQENL
jgi:hypothetical protein